ncbi:hypothetical protein [Okeania sp. SIO1I7]|uniref:hypothetical protein n=1 Tax=Okeania sp. SIO1I7 TaxID=2607772 RepID=UPI0013FC9F5C|nr:hypothetical protein [Okeania sp. SIO1I7]NET25316.1 hypothetical protein [Okeania sp. SIO1I7]
MYFILIFSPGNELALPAGPSGGGEVGDLSLAPKTRSPIKAELRDPYYFDNFLIFELSKTTGQTVA